MLALSPDSLWTDYEPMSVMGLPLGRRVAVARNAAGRLVVFSPLAATPRTIADLRALGEVAAFVVPSRFHDRHYDGYFAAFPRARFLASPIVVADHPGWPLQPIGLDTPELAGFSHEIAAGMPKVQEQVFVHHASRTLLLPIFSSTSPRRPAPGNGSCCAPRASVAGRDLRGSSAR